MLTLSDSGKNPWLKAVRERRRSVDELNAVYD